MILAAASLYAWASSGSVPQSKLAQVTTVDIASPPSPASGDTFTVMTYNIGYLSGMANNLPIRKQRSFYHKNLKTAITLLKDIRPDFVGFQEIDLPSRRSYYMNQVDSIASSVPFGYAAFATNWDKNYVPFPFWTPSAHFGRVHSGQAILSKYPVLVHERFPLTRRQDAPFYLDAFYLDRLAQVVKIDVGRELIIINVHLEAWEHATRAKQATEVLAILKRYRVNYPVLLIGDFNSLSPYAGLASGKRKTYPEFATEDPTIRLFMQEPGMAAAFPQSAYDNNENETYTFTAENPAGKIDYIFYDETRIEALEHSVVRKNSTASDHLPVLMRFRFKKNEMR